MVVELLIFCVDKLLSPFLANTGIPYAMKYRPRTSQVGLIILIGAKK